jgi:prophage antirepressor-like protein
LRWTCFEKRNFMGIELDVLVGHPEHELLFVVSQVARAAGLKAVYNVPFTFKRLKANAGVKWVTLGDLTNHVRGPRDEYGRGLPPNTTLFTEAHVYQMLLRGHAPASEPFRKWVTEEVLPTIRKTGSYNAAESSNPIAVGIMDELKLLRGELVELKEIVKALVYWT